MRSSNLGRRWPWRRSVHVALALGAAACSTSVAHRPQPPGVAEMQGRREPATFRFWAPPGTRFVLTERRSFDAALAGSRTGDHDDSELRWEMTVHPPDGDATVIDERLVRASFVHDGRTVVSGAPDALIQLVFDSEGTLQEVRGTEGASRAVQALAVAGMEPLAGRMFSPEALDALVRSRVQLALGDVVGRPTGEGETWIVPQRAGDNALFTRYTVEGTRPCSAAPEGVPTECAALRVWADVQPRAAEAVARALVETSTQQPAEVIGPSSDRARARYVMWGNVIVQPATLLPSSVKLRETGHLSLRSGGKTYRVDVRALTERRYQYGPRSVATR